MSKAEGNLRGNLVVGIVVALVSAALASGGTFLTVKLREKEVTDSDNQRAIGAARLLADDLRRAEGAMWASLTDCRYRLYDIKINLPQEDKLLLARRLESGEWYTVSQAMASVNLQIARKNEKHAFVQDDVTQIRAVIRRVDEGRQTLEGLSDTKPSSREAIKKELALGRNC